MANWCENLVLQYQSDPPGRELPQRQGGWRNQLHFIRLHYCGCFTVKERSTHTSEMPLGNAANPKPANDGDATTCRYRGGWLRRAGVLTLGTALLTGAGSIAEALEPATPLANYGRQGWATENGLPQNTVQALAQTKDGFLWIGTEVGLVRFDGSGFVVFDQHTSPALPGNDVQCLLAARDGALWVGTSDGLARVQNGAVTTFTTANGMPGNDVRAVDEERDGTVVVRTSVGTANVLMGRVEIAHPGVPEVDPKLSAVLSDGGKVTASKTVVELALRPKAMQRWTVGKELPGTRVQALFADREGTLWIGTNGGLVRYADGKLEKMPVSDPLASASALAIMEDHEGDLWVGTESSGLQILRDQRFRTLTTRDGLASDNTTVVVDDSAGALWVGTAGSGVTTLRPWTSTPARTWSVKDGLLSDVVLSLAAAPNGDVWVGTADGLSGIRRGTVTSFTSADGLPDDFIRSLLADADGSLWIGTRHGLTHWRNAGDLNSGRMETFTTANGLGSDLVGAMARDSAGNLWVATLAGLARLTNGKITNFTTANGLSSSVITAILARAGGTLLIGTQDHGWNLWDGRAFMPVKQNALGGTTIHAILDDGLNHLWFATGGGVARCDCGQATGAMQADCAQWMEFGTADGLRSRETASNSHPSAWRGKNGLLWFATPKGLVEVDPLHFPVNTVAPPVTVERFAVDDADEPVNKANAGLRVSAGHNHFQFEYGGLSFVAPQKVRYRYMLEGFDHQWTDAGARRNAYYTSIPPSTYTFRVQAANNDGVWNMQGAALEFKLEPHFYQTIWFYVLLGVLLIGLVMLVLRLRLLRAKREFNAVLGERTRIAREVHDTLAQGYVGISVQLEVLSELLRLNKVDAAAKHLDTTRGFVREGLADARQSIWALRSQDSGETTLPVRMRRIVEQADGHGLEAQFSIYGAYRPLPPDTEREILRVAQEAIHNVKKHAAANKLTVQLEYRPGEIALELRDDGRGFKQLADGAPAGLPPGHYGLTGMRERAAAIGGSLDVESANTGTTVRLRAPAPSGASLPRDTQERDARDEKEQL
jgi:signal transduction histidine kinase/ligand-binding sensor domain-containing protein